MLQQIIQIFESVSDHSGTLYIKGLNVAMFVFKLCEGKFSKISKFDLIG